MRVFPMRKVAECGFSSRVQERDDDDARVASRNSIDRAQSELLGDTIDTYLYTSMKGKGSSSASPTLSARRRTLGSR